MPKKVKIELDWDLGDPVFLKTDKDLNLRIVVEIRLLPGGVPIYVLGFSDNEPTDHYAIEITDSPPTP